MSPISQGEVHLFHKGGDWVRKEQMRVTVDGAENPTWRDKFKNQTFDLGDNLTLSGILPRERISLVVHNAVVFSGVT